MKKDIKNNFLTVILFFAIICLFKIYTFSNEKIENNGFGYDGLIYKQWTIKCIDSIRNGQTNPFVKNEIGISKYYSQRLAMPLIVKYALISSGNNNSPNNIIITTFLISLLLLLFSYFYLYNYIKTRLETNNILFTLFTIYFIFPIIKFSGYYVFLNDEMAFHLSIIIFVSFFNNQMSMFTIASFIGSITFPPLYIESIILLLFGNVNLKNTQQSFNTKKYFLYLSPIISILPVVIFIIYLRKYNLWVGQNWIIDAVHFQNMALKWHIWGYLSVFSIGLYIAFVIVRISPIYFNFNLRDLTMSVFYNLKKTNMLICTCLILGKYLWVEFWSVGYNGTEYLYDTDYRIFNLLKFNAPSPFLFIVNNFWYFGPVLFFILLNYPKMLKLNNTLNLSEILLISLFLILSVFTESRYLITFYPIVMICLHKHNTIDTRYKLITILSLLITSRFYLDLSKCDWSFGPSVDKKYYLLMYATISVFFIVYLMQWKKINNTKQLDTDDHSTS
jgi:hypothetical protein